MKEFLKIDGMKKKLLCDATSLQVRQLDKFMTSKKQDACTTTAYKNLWMYFEQVRILKDEPKSFQRQYNERNYPHGFGLTKSDAKNFVSTYGLDEENGDDGDDDDYQCGSSRAKRPREETKDDPAAFASNAGFGDDDDDDDDHHHPAGPSPSRLREEAKEEGLRLMTHIAQVRCDADPDVIYDSCPELVKKVKDYLRFIVIYLFIFFPQLFSWYDFLQFCCNISFFRFLRKQNQKKKHAHDVYLGKRIFETRRYNEKFVVRKIAITTVSIK